MFEDDLYKEAQKYYTEPQYVEFTVSTSETFKEKIKNINNLQDIELIQLIRSNYSFIFNIEDKEIVQLFVNERFLNCLIDVVTYNPLSVIEKITCNTIIYEYIVLLGGDNQRIRSLLIKLSKVVNRELVNILLSMRLSSELASCIAFTRNSSMIEEVNVKRINFLLSQQNIEYNDLKQLYRILFGQNIFFLFTYTMFDVYKSLEDWMTTEFIQSHNNISRIILELLEEQSYSDIRVILSSYTKDFHLSHNSDISNVRFRIRDYSKEYPRINYVIYHLAQFEGVYVP